MAGDNERETFYKVVPGKTPEDKTVVLKMIPFESTAVMTGGIVYDEQIIDFCEGRCDNFEDAVPGATVIWCKKINELGKDIQAEAVGRLHYCKYAKVDGVDKTLYDKRVNLNQLNLT